MNLVFVLYIYLFLKCASKENKQNLSFPTFEVTATKRLQDRNAEGWIVASPLRVWEVCVEITF